MRVWRSPKGYGRQDQVVLNVSPRTARYMYRCLRRDEGHGPYLSRLVVIGACCVEVGS